MSAARGHTAAAERPVQDINQLGLRDDLPECTDCGHLFYPDSSPDLDRCWKCAERRDEESV